MTTLTAIISTLPMEPNNLKIHKNAMNTRNHSITTGRDDIRGRPGDLFYIEGDPDIWVLTNVEANGYTIDEYAETYYREEGYLDYKANNHHQAISALKNYLRKTYGDYPYVKIHPHTLIRIHAKEPQT